MTQTLDILRNVPRRWKCGTFCIKVIHMDVNNSREKHNDSTSSSPTVCRFAFHLWICRSSSFRFGKCRLPDLTLPAPVLSIFASHFKTYETMRSVSTTIHQIPPENQRTEKTKATICPVISMCFAGLRQSLCD